MKKVILFGFVLSFSVSVQAQLKQKIKKGRRNKSEAQYTLDKNQLQFDWETGHETINSNISTTIYPNLAVRYGVSRRLELNTELSFLTATDNTIIKQTTTGFEPIIPGMNYLLFDETVNAPAVIISTQVALPFLASKNFVASHIAPTLQVNFQKSIQKWAFGLSTGSFWDGFNPKPSFIYNASLGYNLSEQWIVFSELFGFVNSGLPQHNLDINLVYQKNKNFQLGCTGGFGLSSAAHKSYFALNGSWAFSLKRK